MKTQSKVYEAAIDQKLVETRRQSRKWLSDIEHRLEFVDTVNGVEYINDAKADDVNSAWYSIDCLEKPIWWIMHSSAYESDFELINEIDTKCLKGVIVVGAHANAVVEVFKSKVEILHSTKSVMEALKLVRGLAIGGDAVLYAPAFSDMDQFVHYKERGQQFRKAVREMQL